MGTALILGGIEADILAALGRHRYLNLAHMVRLRRVRGDKETRTALRKLELAGMVGRQDCGPVPGLGRLPSCYWLTKKGAETAADLGGGSPVPYPSRVSLSLPQLPHRYLLLDAMVSLDLWAVDSGQEVERWGSFFTTDTTHLKGLRIKPDGLAVLGGRDGIARPYLIEASRGEYRGGERHAMDTLAQHIAAVAGSALDRAVWGDDTTTGRSAVRLLVVFDTPATQGKVLQGILRRPGIPSPDSPVWQRVFFKAGTALEPFPKGWRQIGVNSIDLPDGLGSP